MSRLGPTGLTQLLTDIKTWVLSKIPTKTSQLTNDSNFLTSHQSLSNYSTLANTVKSISISGKTITVTPGSGSAYTLTTQDTNTDTLVTQNVSTTNSTYPILLCATANATANQGAKTSIFGSGVKVNPNTSTISATSLKGTFANNGDTFAYTTAQALYFYSGQPAIANCTEGSSNDFTKFSYPNGATTVSSSTANIQSLRLVWSDTWWHEIFSSPNKEYLWHRNIMNGTAKGWRRIVEENVSGITDQTWNINIGGSSASCTGNAATATQFSANTTVALTGDATGTSAGSKKGWSVPVTLANSGVTAGTYGPSADVTGNNNATISVPQITVDAKGRVTSVTNRTLTCKNNTYSVYNKTLTIQKNGTNVATFTSNSNTDVTANITVPTKTSELTNDSGFLTSHQSLSNYVTLNGAQTISGAKTFSGLTKTSGKTEYDSSSNLDNAINNIETTFWGTGTTNKPASSYGTLLTFNREGNVHTSTSNGWLAQLGMGTDARLFLRTKANTGGSWSAWKEFLTSHQSLSNYVTLNGAQTISGNKTLTGYVDCAPYRVRIKHGSQEIGVTPSSNQWNGIVFSDKNGATTFSIEQAFLKNGNAMLHFSMMPNNASGSLLRIFEATHYASSGVVETKSKTLVPDENNSRDLGSSSNVWKNVYATTFSGALTGNVTGNCSGTSANVTGTVAIANGGTGATTRLNAVKALTNENVGTAATYFLGITNSWGKAGYISVADARTVLGIPTFDFQKFVWDHTINLSSMASSSEWEQITGGFKYTASVSLKAGQLTWIYVYLTTSNDLIKITISNGYILSGKNCVDGGKNSIKADTTTYGNVLTQTVCGASRLNCLFYPYNSTVTLTMTYTILAHAGGEDPTLSGKVLIKQ